MNVVKIIDGKEVQFKRLQAKQVAEYCELAYQFYRKTILEDKQAGDDVGGALEKLRLIRGDLQLLWRYIWTPQGALAVIAANNDAGVDGLSVHEICELAGELCGFDMTVVQSGKAEKPSDGDGFVRPQNAGSGNT